VQREKFNIVDFVDEFMRDIKSWVYYRLSSELMFQAIISSGIYDALTLNLKC